MLIDTHCHLDAPDFNPDRDDVMRSALDSGVSAVIIPAVEPGNFAEVRGCCLRYPQCLPAYGIHPLYVGSAGEKDLQFLRDWLSREAVGEVPPVAVGEIGLDFFVPGCDTLRQEYYFVEQLKIAEQAGLPVLIHVRRAVDQVLKCLRRSGVRGGIAHAFNGSRQQAEAFVALGFQLGFGGSMTYPGATRIRQLAATLPLETIVLETDAPDIPPAWLVAGKTKPRNTPDQLLRIATVLAELRGQSLSTILEATTANADKFVRTQV